MTRSTSSGELADATSSLGLRERGKRRRTERILDAGLELLRQNPEENLTVDPPRLLVQTFSALWSDEVKDPAAVRYAWANNPACNMYNKEGLPASPFRTDNWRLQTEDNK